MAITIIDSFKVNTAGPVDLRIIATAASDRVAMGLTSISEPYSFVYDGLKCFQLSDRTNWIWNDSLGTWSSDSYGDVISSPSKIPYLSFWTASSILGYAPIYITQSDNLQLTKHLYLGGGTLPYEVVIGSSTTNWLTLASSNNYNGIQIRNDTNASDKINSGGQVTHQFYGDVTNSVTKMYTSSAYAQINLDTSLTISSDKGISIGQDDATTAGANTILHAGNSSLSTGGNVYLISGGGLATPGDVFIISAADSSGTAKAGNIKLLTGYGAGPFTDPQSGFIEASAPIKFSSSMYEKSRIQSVSNANITISDIDKNVIINNTGSSGILVSLPDLSGKYDGRKVSIQCATFSNVATLTPYGTQKIYYGGSFQSSIPLYKGSSVDILSYNQNWYVVSSSFIDENWKQIGSGGTLWNGQAVPSYITAGLSDIVQPIKFNNGAGLSFMDNLVGTGTYVGKDTHSNIKIWGAFQFTGIGTTDVSIFTMPIGYRPTIQTIIPCVVVYSTVAGNRIPSIGGEEVLYIRTSGNLRLSNIDSSGGWVYCTVYFNSQYATI